MKFYKFLKPKDSSDPFLIREGRFGELGSSNYKKWAEDSFISEAGSREKISRENSIGETLFFKIVFAIVFILLFARLVQLQIVKGDYYFGLAEGNRIRTERIEARRGVIYDRFGNILANNTANFALYLIPSDLPKDEGAKAQVLTEVSNFLGLKNNELFDFANKLDKTSLEYYQPVIIADSLPHDMAVSAYLHIDSWTGFSLTNKSRREYQLYSLGLSHILGYTGKINQKELDSVGDEYSPIDYIGKTGLEYFYENFLRGRDGKKKTEVDALGRKKKIISEELAENGDSIVLNISAPAQQKLEQIMADQLKKLNLTRASAIVMDPRNGGIIAMVSLPAYNNNDFARGIGSEEYKLLSENPDHPLFNRAVSGEYPPGSTIKPVVSSGALEEGVISENTSFLSNGGLRIGQWFFPDWKAGGHGMTNVKKAIAESVNTFFYYVGGGYQDFIGLGLDRLTKYFRIFGLGEQTGIDLPGEATGFVPSAKWKEDTKNEAWYIGDTYHLAIGQGDLSATPLQIAMTTSVFANYGTIFRPHLAQKIIDDKGNVVQEFPGEAIKKDFISQKTLSVVREGMRQTVTSGSARSFSTLPFEVAAKTGTAQWSTKKAPHAWFTCFAPYQNPEIVVTIIIEEGAEGSTAAAPIAKQFLEWYFQKSPQ